METTIAEVVFTNDETDELTIDLETLSDAELAKVGGGEGIFVF